MDVTTLLMYNDKAFEELCFPDACGFKAPFIVGVLDLVFSKLP